eukprot:CAMPEP_0183519822 /NCGR_PEP_ID=MMETSP0371-20130417/16426_1 /TAXON_ID=268820 /ORGANISM="Peridinium aciculiferum, Strain PAER-2" /LENGTH=35 /DNA_ID= /DNA_START= /DNA_END= /DNA_ORIENTATION=
MAIAMMTCNRIEMGIGRNTRDGCTDGGVRMHLLDA